jgi:energy-coupling factor transporter transmembrane protein EcfT
MMEETFVKAEELAEHVKEYINNRMDAVKLNTAEKSSKLLATVIASVVVAMFFVTFLFFASTALAFVFSKLTGALSWGFLIVGGIYLLLGALVWMLKSRILQLPIMNALLRQFFTEEDDDDE